LEQTYAIGDGVSLSGPKMGHMAVRQAEVAATNLLAELNGQEPTVRYNHELKLIIDEGGSESLYVHGDLCDNQPANVRHGRFWMWAKQVQQKYWESAHLS
jgi:sulfide:quinone oxidoreductase